jgi:phage tail-like protein
VSSDSSVYRFETAAQWNACLFRGAGHSTRADRGFVPQAPYAFDARFIDCPDARAPALTPGGEFLWADGTHLFTTMPTADLVARITAPWPIANAARIVASHDALWVAGDAAGTLECFDRATLARRRVITIDGEVLDLAYAGRDTLLVLTRRGTVREILRLDCAGELESLATLTEGLQAVQLAALNGASPGTVDIVMLEAGGARLHGVTLATGKTHRHAATAAAPRWSVPLGTLHPCFKGAWLASDGRADVVVAGTDGKHFGGKPFALLLDRDATLIDALQLLAPATGVAVGRGYLLVSRADGVSIHARAQVAGDSAGLSAELLTPLLLAPNGDTEMRWQRADVWATLPPGTSLEVRYGWIEDPDRRTEAANLARDAEIPEAGRLDRLERAIDHWSAPVTFAGTADAASSAPFSFPLLDARVARLWLRVTLRAAPRAALPAISKLHVSWAGSAMLDKLPSIYRRTAAQPGDFLGALVGVFEATSQDLDRHIDSLGSLVHPDTAPLPWLDELAEWLGLPWDDGLAPAQKRALLSAAGTLASQRGTRAGLEALLGALFPGKPRRFGVSDGDVDFGFATLGGACKGGASSRGSALPAILAGLPRTATVLSRKTILGQARLPCRGEAPSATARLSGNLRIDLTVDAAVRSASEPWLARLIEAMVPAHVRVEFRWHVPHGTPFRGLGELPATPLTRLGDAITGIARLPDTGGRILSS